MSEVEAMAIAEKFLDQYGVKHPGLYKELYEKILVFGKPKAIRIYWDSRAQDIKMEITY